MTQGAQIIPTDSGAQAAPPPPVAIDDASATESWRALRESADIQFEPINYAVPEPHEPGWFEQALAGFFNFLGDLLSPIGALIGASWGVLQWVLIGLVVGFVLYMIARTVGPLAGRNRKAETAESEPEWRPDEKESIALLDDADRLAAEGRFDEATHLLLKRSVNQISTARPDWVEPSSTARELAALPALSLAARTAFRIISERVERSLFALRSLDRSDWEAARAAYAEFALTKIEAPGARGEVAA